MVDVACCPDRSRAAADCVVRMVLQVRSDLCPACEVPLGPRNGARAVSYAIKTHMCKTGYRKDCGFWIRACVSPIRGRVFGCIKSDHFVHMS